MFALVGAGVRVALPVQNVYSQSFNVLTRKGAQTGLSVCAPLRFRAVYE
ncbi:hypothetical protein DWUX_1571 [Desulfovibrio diazotrophicus]|nr:hypothetical protein DWUX_1571 [Desulfovibrio diazotrophicus]